MVNGGRLSLNVYISKSMFCIIHTYIYLFTYLPERKPWVHLQVQLLLLKPHGLSHLSQCPIHRPHDYTLFYLRKRIPPSSWRLVLPVWYVCIYVSSSCYKRELEGEGGLTLAPMMGWAPINQCHKGRHTLSFAATSCQTCMYICKTHHRYIRSVWGVTGCSPYPPIYLPTYLRRKEPLNRRRSTCSHRGRGWWG